MKDGAPVRQAKIRVSLLDLLGPFSKGISAKYDCSRNASSSVVKFFLLSAAVVQNTIKTILARKWKFNTLQKKTANTLTYMQPE